MVRLTTFAIALAAFLPIAFAHPANGPRNTLFGCGTEPSAEFLAKTEELAALEANTTQADFKIAAAAATITIQTYFHVRNTRQARKTRKTSALGSLY